VARGVAVGGALGEGEGMMSCSFAGPDVAADVAVDAVVGVARLVGAVCGIQAASASMSASAIKHAEAARPLDFRDIIALLPWPGLAHVVKAPALMSVHGGAEAARP
jgi:hypothetical protein